MNLSTTKKYKAEHGWQIYVDRTSGREITLTNRCCMKNTKRKQEMFVENIRLDIIIIII